VRCCGGFTNRRSISTSAVPVWAVIRVALLPAGRGDLLLPIGVALLLPSIDITLPRLAFGGVELGKEIGL
jgi:hypothetical protein